MLHESDLMPFPAVEMGGGPNVLQLVFKNVLASSFFASYGLHTLDLLFNHTACNMLSINRRC